MNRTLILPGRVKVHYLILPLVLLLFLLVFVADVQAEKPAVDSHGFYYTVQPGDTLFKIATRYGTTVYAITTANNIVNPNLIYTGSVLWVPTGGQPPVAVQPLPPSTACRYYHTVTWGDTMIKLGQQYGRSPWAIGQANGIYNLNLIYRGQTLCIP